MPFQKIQLKQKKLVKKLEKRQKTGWPIRKFYLRKLYFTKEEFEKIK